jgi:hypothetical protein
VGVVDRHLSDVPRESERLVDDGSKGVRTSDREDRDGWLADHIGIPGGGDRGRHVRRLVAEEVLRVASTLVLGSFLAGRACRRYTHRAHEATSVARPDWI